jgi:hypothetical protein
MTAVFKTPKMPTPQQVAPEVTAAQKRQEERLAAQEDLQKRQMAARQRAQRRGGSRQLLASVRGGSADDQTTLGV